MNEHPPRQPSTTDTAMEEYIAELRLHELDLSNLPASEPAFDTNSGMPVSLWLSCLGLVITMVLVAAWWPSEGLEGDIDYISVVAVLLAGMGLWFASEVFGSWPQLLDHWQWVWQAQRPPWRQRLALSFPWVRAFQPLWRHAPLLGVAAIGGVLWWTMPRQTIHPGDISLASVLLATIAGLLINRWLIRAAWAPSHQRTKPRPLHSVWWHKWVFLLLLLVGAGVALGWGDHSAADQSHFLRSALGFLVGLGAAIWMVQRFDDMENKADLNRRIQSRLRQHSSDD